MQNEPESRHQESRARHHRKWWALLAIIVMGDCACSVMNTTSGIQRSVKFTLPKVLTTPS